MNCFSITNRATSLFVVRSQRYNPLCTISYGGKLQLLDNLPSISRYYSNTPSLQKQYSPSIRIQRRDHNQQKKNDAQLQPTSPTRKTKQYDSSSYKYKQKHTTPSSYNKPACKPFKAPYTAFISCLPGLEPLLLQEVQYLLPSLSSTTENNKNNSSQHQNHKIVPGGITTSILSVAHLYLLHLYLGTASHVYLRFNDNNSKDNSHNNSNIPPLFHARGWDELKRKIKDLILAQQWDKFLDLPASSTKKERPATMIEAGKLSWQLQVHVTTSKSKLMHTKAVEQRVREVIGEVFGINGLLDHAGDKKDNRPIVRLLIRIERDEVQLSLDTSSSISAIPLHMRGYRKNPFQAPLREDLAFGLCMVGGIIPAWDLHPLHSLLGGGNTGSSVDAPKKKEKKTTVQLFDPMCGSGTVAIEGASILAGLPPGRFREPPLQGTKLYNEKLWNDMKSKALQAADDKTNNILVAANDINQRAIKAAKLNATQAGVEKLIDFQVGSFRNHPIFNSSSRKQSPTLHISKESKSPLHVITNPPFGGRLSAKVSGKSSIYKQIGKAIRSLSPSNNNIQCTMIGKDHKELRKVGLPLEVGFSTRQGGLGVVAMTTREKTK